MRSTPMLLLLYLLNAAVLITHEIDSAYWHEWELFGIPGGIQAFLGLNLLLVVAILYGLQALALGHKSGTVLAWMLVAGGLFAVIIHSYFLLRGSQAFSSLASLALLFAAFVLSLAQAVALMKSKQPA
jgi:hypothetical protein